MPPVIRMDADTPHLNPPATKPARWVGLFILIYIALQLIIPLRYYLQASTSDERFAWRMFSYQGMHRCTAQAWEVIEQQGKRTIERLELPAVTHAYRLDKDRPDVIAKFMRWRLEQPGVVQVRYTILCTSPSGTTVEPRHYWMDRSEQVLREGEPES